jgi:predicted nuclease with TOPRIM domain
MVMENPERSFKIMAWVFTALLVLSAAGALYYRNENLDAARTKAQIEQRLDSLQTSHEQLAKKSSALNSQLDTARRNNVSLTGQVAESRDLLNRKEVLVRSLRNSVSSLRDTMQTQVASLTEQSERITGENQSLADKNAELNKQIEELNKELAMRVPRSVVTADGFRVEAVKHNDKVTAKAKKVHTLMVSCNVPAELGLEGTREVYLSLNDGQNHALLAPLTTALVQLAGSSQTIPVHAIQKVDFSKGSQPVSFTIESADDFQPRTYRASVFTKDAYLGSVEFKLRDSFWFF